jgi:hypothetical protein
MKPLSFGELASISGCNKTRLRNFIIRKKIIFDGDYNRLGNKHRRFTDRDVLLCSFAQRLVRYLDTKDALPLAQQMMSVSANAMIWRSEDGRWHLEDMGIYKIRSLPQHQLMIVIDVAWIRREVCDKTIEILKQREKSGYVIYCNPTVLEEIRASEMVMGRSTHEA